MKISENGKLALASSEGIVTTAYKDSVGVWTIGIGHTRSAGAPNPMDFRGKQITVEKALEIFSKDIKIYEEIVNRLVKVQLEQHEFDALVHFVYNIGEGNFKKSKLLVNLNKGNKKLAFSSGFHGWLKPKELKSRRDKEKKIALTGNYGDLTVSVISNVNKNFQPLFSKSKRVRIKNIIDNAPNNFNELKESAEKMIKSQNFFMIILNFIKRIFFKTP